MYGKIFGHLFEGSMVGSGSTVFAVMAYVIAKMVPDREHGAVVEINPKLLAFSLGEKEPEVQKAIDYLCAPDKNSRSPEEQGRRLVRLGQFEYRVVNGAKYREVRDQEQRRVQLRDAQARLRFKKKNPGKPLPGELQYVKAFEDGASDEQLGKLSAPKKKHH